MLEPSPSTRPVRRYPLLPQSLALYGEDAVTAPYSADERARANAPAAYATARWPALSSTPRISHAI